MKKVSIWIAILIMVNVQVTAAEQDTLPAGIVRAVRQPDVVHFRIGSAAIDPSFMDNRATLEQFAAVFRTAVENPGQMPRIVVRGTTSPDGREDVNIALAEQRAQALAAYLSERVPLPKGIVEIVNGGEDWQELRAMVAASAMNYRDEMLFVMDNEPQREQRKNTLMFMADSEPWLYAYEHFFPRLHAASAELIFAADSDRVLATGDTTVFRNRELQADTLHGGIPQHIPEELSEEMRAAILQATGKQDKGPRLALKTNTLYWAALLPNLEIEYYTGRRWSVNLEYQGAWWSSQEKCRFYRIATFSPEVRYWFAQKERFHGHFGGVYVGGGWYELMGGPSKGIQGEFFIAGGLSYGYSFPVGRALGLECSLGVGYLMTRYRQYHYDAGCYVYEQSKQTSFIGPTKAKVSLVWRLGGNRKKP